jgi:uncharacterized protein (TIGR02611 family)
VDGAREEGQPVEKRDIPDEQPSKLRELFEKLEHRRESYKERGLLYRVAFTTAGFTVLAGGVAMLVLPGPALAVIPIGLAMLALQFAWAERLLEVAIDRAEAAGKTVTETTRKQKIVGGIAIALLVGACVTAAIQWDIPLLPV